MQSIKWLPFSQRHIDYILASKDNKANVAEGAVRAGKTTKTLMRLESP